MKRLIKAILITVLALTVAVTSFIVVAAEVVNTSDGDSTAAVIESAGDNTREYELVWKFKADGVHVWKRRWNMTLGIWYDPDWILVY